MKEAADGLSVWLKKVKVKIGIRWIFYALMALFALNALGLFQTVFGLGSSGIELSFELSSALVFGLFLYLSYESNKHAGNLERRLANQAVGLEANIKSLKKTIEEKSSETAGRISGLEGMVTKIGGGVASVEGTLSKLEQQMSQIGGRVDGLEAKASTIQGGLANVEQTLSKIGETESQIGGRVGGLEGMVTNVEGGVTNIEGKLSKIEGKASETAGRIGGLEGMVPKIGKMQARMSNIERGLVRIEGRVSRIAKRQERLSKIERSVNKIEGRVSKIAKMQGRRSTTIRRRKARIPSRGEIQKVSPEDISKVEGPQEATPQ